MGENGLLERNARELDLYCVSARYPNAFPSGAPFEIITAEQAEPALRGAREIVHTIRKRVTDVLEDP